MRITITGASGLIGSRLTKALEQRGDEVTPLSLRSDTDLAAEARGPRRRRPPRGRERRPALDRRRQAQRIRDSREQGTRRLVEALEDADPRPKALISASAVGYYGPHGDEQLDEDAPPGDDFLAEVCVAWEREAAARRALGCASCASAPASCSTRTAARSRRCCCRSSSARAARSPAATSTCRGSTSTTSSGSTSPRSTTTGRGPVNATAPEPVTNKEFSKALGRALHRPAVAPHPRASRSRRSTATWPRSSPRASAPSHGARWRSATQFRTPSSTRRCAPRVG